MKEEDIIQILGCNQNGIRTDQLKSELQHSLDLDIDIQCYSEVNADVLQPKVRQKFYEYPRLIDKSMQLVWSTSKIPIINEYKPGGTGICINGKAASRIEKSHNDEYSRWSYQVLDGKGKKEVLIISVYQCCKFKVPNTAYQQEMKMHTLDDKKKIDPRKLFYRDITAMIK